MFDELVQFEFNLKAEWEALGRQYFILLRNHNRISASQSTTNSRSLLNYIWNEMKRKEKQKVESNKLVRMPDE